MKRSKRHRQNRKKTSPKQLYEANQVFAARVKAKALKIVQHVWDEKIKKYMPINPNYKNN